MDEPHPADDANAVIGGFLRDLAFVQTTPPKMFGYTRAAAAVFAYDRGHWPPRTLANWPGRVRLAAIGSRRSPPTRMVEKSRAAWRWLTPRTSD